MIDKIKNMKVEKKLKTCFTLTVMIASLAGIIGLFILLYCNVRYGRALVSNGFSQGEIGIFSTYLSREPTLVRELIILSDEQKMKEADEQLNAGKDLTDQAYETAKKHCTTKQELAYIAQIDELLPQYRSYFTEVESLAMAHNDEEATDLLLNQAKPVYQQLTAIVEELIDYNVEIGNDVKSQLTIQIYIMIGIMLLIIIVAVIIAMRISKSVAKILAEPIVRIQEATGQLEQGNLDVHVDVMYPDEIGEMTQSFNTAIGLLKDYIRELSRVLGSFAEGNFAVTADADFRGEFKQLGTAIDTITESLSSTLGNIHEASNQVSLGASQMSESAQSLAEGATDQAASVQELTATIQDITETVIHSSEKANQSYKDAETFRRNAEESSEDIRLLNQAMERINDTSREIANIIAAIEDIASQTNLLSLNASIEAARAGEAGKGFAVVADQIGKLASDSANSAVDTKKLIENSLQEIEKGNEIMAKATAAIEIVIKGINSLAVSTNEISELSDSQAEAMRQLEEGIEQISEVIQNNSAAAEQSSATSEELSAQSESLEQLVGRFILK
ncbi:MAG: methyl-accepting chemotaxis protein [Eubacterium sp.]|nr:methyl-accepting chemotaxis protein [Eubacterium sp.]